MRGIIAILSLSILVTGCSSPTKYQPEGMTGGFTDTQLDKNIFRVTFKGNGFTSPERAQDLALLRSAELALKNGFNYFAIIDERARVSTGVVTTPTQSNTTGSATVIGSSVYGQSRTTTTGGIPIVISRPSTTNTIYCFVDRPSDSIYVYDARFLWESLSKKYGAAPSR